MLAPFVRQAEVCGVSCSSERPQLPRDCTFFFALALLSAAPVFHASGHAAVRNGMLIAAALSVAGMVGPAVNHIALRQIGIVGYAIVWPIVCLPLSKAFRERPIVGAASPLVPGQEPEDASHGARHETLHRAS
jgi:hypothetical protein